MNANSFPTEGRPPFVFVANPATIANQLEEGDLLVRIPADIEDSQTLFRCYESPLHFPGYFGWNWDAFRNCLLDLSWLDPMPLRIFIVHEGLPFAADRQQRQIYLEVLSEVAACDCGPAFQFVFASNLADLIRREWANCD